jgi:hypothetical protein
MDKFLIVKNSVNNYLISNTKLTSYWFILAFFIIYKYEQSVFPNIFLSMVLTTHNVSRGGQYVKYRPRTPVSRQPPPLRLWFRPWGVELLGAQTVPIVSSPRRPNGLLAAPPQRWRNACLRWWPYCTPTGVKNTRMLASWRVMTRVLGFDWEKFLLPTEMGEIQ